MRTNIVIDDQLMADALKATGLSYSLCDKFNLYSSNRSLCPLCLCGSFPSLFIAGSLH
ncbi:type II toxin-antitoxin system VapB family antitoxin [Microcystis aeruginosa]|uniref:DUF2191 domain-containing protein n=1 Tax=Microcystis aeruginosa PCC 9443 TaxID=1160281 RepID=I4G171_MICAE|nr:hypothetical protein MICAC_2450004 [Microcystis aeruginosa PCC 9443]